MFHANNSLTESEQSSVNKFLTKTYGYMGLAVFVSFLSAFFVITEDPTLVYNGHFALISFMVMLIMAFTLRKAAISSPILGFVLLMTFSVLNGVSLSALAMAYSGHTIMVAFLGSAIMFGGAAFAGFTGRIDMDGWGLYLGMGLLGLLAVSILNLFFKSSGLMLIISIVGVFLFVAMSAWDAKNAYDSYQKLSKHDINENSIAVLNAFDLYLDFINLFIYVVRLLGSLSDFSN